MSRYHNTVIRECGPGILQRLALILLLSWPLLAIASEADRYLREAESYYNRNEFSAAVIQLKNSLLANPGNGEARLLLGKAYLEVKDGPSASKELTRAQELGIPRERVLEPLGRALLMSGQYNKLLNTITAQAGDPAKLRIDILLLQGQACLATRKFAMAEEKFTGALELQPDSAEAMLGMARISHRNGDLSGATSLIEQALSAEPDNTQAWSMKGALLRSGGQTQEAIVAFDKALAIDPGNMSAYLGRAMGHIALGQPDRALKDIAAAQQGKAQPYLADYLRALAYYQKQKIKPAREAVQRSLKHRQDFLPAHLLAGTLAYRQGEYNQAEKHLRTYWTRAPQNTNAAKLLGAALMKLDRPGRTIEVLEPGVDQAADDAQYLALLGSAYMAQGDTGKGVEYLQQATDIAPDVASIRTQLAIGQLVQGDMDGATSELESAVDLGQELMQAELLLVMAYLKGKEFDKALDLAGKMAKNRPSSPVPQNLIGVALLGKGEQVAARQAFDRAISLQADFSPPYLNLAQLDILAGDGSAAETRYMTVLSHDEGNLKALYGLAGLANRKGDSDRTERWLKQARDHHPEAVEPALLLLEHYQRQGHKERARDITRELVVAYPRDPRALRAATITYLQAGDHKAATDASRSLIEISPQSAEAHYLLGMVLLKQNKHSDARISLSRAVELQPDFPMAQLALARLDILGQDFDPALAIAADLEQAHPEAAFADELRGDIAVARKASQEAADAYALAYDKQASAQLARKLYQSRLQANDTDAALAALQRWLKEHPGDVTTRSLFAQALTNTDRQQQAIDEYLKIIEHDTKNVTALNNIAWLYKEQGNYPEGVKYAERAHQLVPERPEVTDTLGWLLLHNGEINRGLVLLQEARVKAPHIADIHYHLAVALHKAGRNDEARKELDRLLRAGKTFPDIENARRLRKDLGG